MDRLELNKLTEFIFQFGPLQRFVYRSNPLWKIITDFAGFTEEQLAHGTILYDDREWVRIIVAHGELWLEVEPAIPA